MSLHFIHIKGTPCNGVEHVIAKRARPHNEGQKWRWLMVMWLCSHARKPKCRKKGASKAYIKVICKTVHDYSYKGLVTGERVHVTMVLVTVVMMDLWDDVSTICMIWYDMVRWHMIWSNYSQHCKNTALWEGIGTWLIIGGTLVIGGSMTNRNVEISLEISWDQWRLKAWRLICWLEKWNKTMESMQSTERVNTKINKRSKGPDILKASTIHNSATNS